MIQEDYFLEFEDRTPPPPLDYNPWREALWQFLAVLALVIGAWYIIWRWTGSLNPDAMWFAVPLVVAETCAFIGMVFLVWAEYTEFATITPESRLICKLKP